MWEISENKNDDKEYRLACRECNGQTYHQVLKSVQIHEFEGGIDVWRDYEIVTCKGCKDVSFRLSSVCSEDVEYDQETGESFPIEDIELYPNRIAGRKQLNEMYSLPNDVLRIYKETHSVLCGHLNILAGIGMRTLVEAVCRDRNAKGVKLENKIDDLVVKGVLTREGADILHRTRILGNRAAHEIAVTSDKELGIAMDIVENLLETVYLIPEKAKRLKK